MVINDQSTQKVNIIENVTEVTETIVVKNHHTHVTTRHRSNKNQTTLENDSGEKELS